MTSRAPREAASAARRARASDDGLSILAAARDAGPEVALHDGATRLTFADLARRAGQRIEALARGHPGSGPVPLVGSNTVDALVAFYALLELRRPALLLHPRLTAPERAAKIEAATRAAETVPDDAAAILFTSGTTGRPRGAVLTRAALRASARASEANLGWQPGDCWGLTMPFARVGGLSIVTRCLAARRPVAIAPAFDAAALPRWIEAHGVTLLSLVPTMLSMVLDADPRWRPPPRLRALLLGGAAAPRALLERALERGWPIVVTFGCTETCSQVAATPYELRWDTARAGAGRPLTGVELRIDGGRVLVRGPMRMAGYLGEPPLPADGWFDTGDRGELDADGFLHLHGRGGDLLVTGGENVYPAEVERTLESCPGIAAAAVFGLPDETWGQTVAAALVGGDRPPDEAALAAFMDQCLAPHKRPRAVCWVSSLPQTPAGKLDRAALSALAPALRPLRRRPADAAS